jgi:putative addiction module component (TIGR02574 family)
MAYCLVMATGASYAHLEEEALQLPLEERSRLASRLLESLDDGFELSPEWREELQRRVKQIDEGTVRMIPGEEVSANIRARLAEGHSTRQ